MKRERLLIVENEKIIALDLKNRLESLNYQVEGMASNASDALVLAEKLTPDIILMDIMLNDDMDGIEAAKIIYNQLHIPIIFLTAYADELTLQRAKEAEPLGYILKPFKERELYTTIDIAFYKHRIDKKLRRQERWSSAILHSIGDGIIATDKENLITFMNPVAEELTLWEEESAKGENIAEIIPLADVQTEDIMAFPAITDASSLIQGRTIKNSFLKNKDGEKIPVEGTISIIQDRDGNIEGQVVALRDISEKQELSNKIHYQANHDALTGLINRTAFSYELNSLIEFSRRSETEHAFIYLDLDQFKLINDTVGHEAGDELLLETTAIIQSVVRGSDTCGRLGGDEFGILLKNSKQEQAKIIAQRLHSRLADKKLIWGRHSFSIHSSIGLVIINSESENLENILAAADFACSLAKDQGGKKIKIYKGSDSLFLKRRGEMEWVSKLTQALEEDWFVLYSQDIVPLKSRQDIARKCEILIRLKEPGKEIITPAQFIPAAERYHLMEQVDRWVISNTLRTIRRFDLIEYSGSRGMQYSINLSAQSLADENTLDYIYEQFKIHKVNPVKICFEITETAAISNMVLANKFILTLKEIGCTFALDDFGSGFSSFNYLKSMPIDFLKIDGSFVKDMDKNSVNRAMVEAMNNLGHIIGVQTIAEFVHSQEIKENCISLEVDYAQGFELSKPQPLMKLVTV